MSSRPTRTANPTSRLLDPDNIGAPAIFSHRQAVADAAAAKVRAAEAQAMLLEHPEILPRRASSSLSITEPPPSTGTLSSRQPSPVNKRPRESEAAIGSDTDLESNNNSGNDSDAKTKKKPAKKRRRQGQKLRSESDFF